MNLDRMLSVISTLLGFFGSIFLARGVLKLTPDIIAKQSTSYWGYNKFQLENIITQKADFVCGVSLIFIAFLIQIINLVFVYNSCKIFSPYRAGIVIVCSISFLLATMLYRSSRIKKYRSDSLKSLAKQKLEKIYNDIVIGDKTISYPRYEEFLKQAEDFFNIKKENGESPANFLKRYSEFLEVNIPADIDFSELHKNRNK